MIDCVFCQISSGTAPAQRVYEDEHAIAFMDINPATDGHTLVIPRRHARDLWEVGEDEARHLMAATYRVAHMLRRALTPDGMNLLHASGAVAFQSVFHFHVHVVPRYSGDRISLPWIPTPGDPAGIAQIAGRIRSAG
ncbi:MAG: HIT family protein [Acidobacteria bacterium]|nr:HIT family protein [Acidobacteriota bacterium]